MWTKNGERTLPLVLKRIDEVIPQENVNDKILVDDHSTDNTVKIAKDFNWKVYVNPNSGIPFGANEALRHVTTPIFISFEQDLLLAKDWWDCIPPYMQEPNIAVAGGIRVFDNRILRAISGFHSERLGKQGEIEVSMDNTIYKTKVIKALGGFPNECPICTDTILYKKINWFTPYKWVIDSKVVSLHLRKGIRHELEHSGVMANKCKRTKLCGCYYVPHFNEPTLIIKPKFAASKLTLVRMFLTSPIRGFHVAVKKKCPEIFFVYPLIRLYIFKSCLKTDRLRG